jgi:hypothetical protein
VDASLKDKIKCLIFIPIISRTYCDPKSFAWEHEFKAFVEQASKDRFGLKVKFTNGNVASRVLSIRIHDLDTEDIKLCESIVGGVLRGVEFIYKEPGVNRPLRSNEDNPHDNLNHTIYRNQVNKVALAVRDLIESMRGSEILDNDVTPAKKYKKQNIVKATKKEDKLTIDGIVENTIPYGYALETIGGKSINASDSYSENIFNQEIEKLILNENLAEQIAFSHLLVKNDIIQITFKRSDKIVNLMNDLSKRIPENSDEIFNINQGGGEITIVCESSKESLFKHLLPEAIEIRRKTAIIRIQEAKERKIRPSIEVPGLFAFFIGSISNNNINILDLISTRTQLSVLVDEDDLMKAYLILNNSIKYFRNKISNSI